MAAYAQFGYSYPTASQVNTRHLLLNRNDIGVPISNYEINEYPSAMYNYHNMKLGRKKIVINFSYHYIA